MGKEEVYEALKEKNYDLEFVPREEVKEEPEEEGVEEEETE